MELMGGSYTQNVAALPRAGWAAVQAIVPPQTGPGHSRCGWVLDTFRLAPPAKQGSSCKRRQFSQGDQHWLRTAGKEG